MGSTRVQAAVIAGVALSALALGTSAQASPPKHRPCPRKGAEVIASDRAVRVYSYPLVNAGAAQLRRSEACLVGRGTRMTLYNPERDRPWHVGGFSVIALSGTIVAYSISHHGVDTGSSVVLEAEIATRRILRELPGAREGFVDAGVISRTRLTDFALTPSGSAAWIDAATGIKHPRTYSVHVAPIGQQELVLDEGANIDPSSLELSRGTLSWVDAGVRRTARLGS